MKSNKKKFKKIFVRVAWIALFVSMVLVEGCTVLKESTLVISNSVNPYHPEKIKWLDWNVMFLPGTSATRRNQTIDSIRKRITDYYSSFNPTYDMNQCYVSCPCEPEMVNISATPVFGSGSAPIPPPVPPGRGVGGSGDGVDFIQINNLVNIEVDSSEFNLAPNGNLVVLKTPVVDESKILAVMDTGLDTLYFQNHFKDLLWTDNNGNTLRNFLFFKNSLPYGYYEDDDKSKHGTAVTALALKASESYSDQIHNNPKVMVLKVLDENKTGSTFTISCAMSYAIQKHVTLINASLGYYGALDSLLDKYAKLVKAEQNNIHVIAAAGNLLPPHKENLICSPAGPGNELKDSRLFFPGCFSELNTNIITVTTLFDATNSCFYQNYSNKFVNLGVIANTSSTNCCKFLVPYTNKGYEGSSFATPVVSGKIMGCLLTTAGVTVAGCIDIFSPLPSPIPPNPATKEGRHFKYKTP